jgi:predicted RNase H-like HicB family nuclease
MKICIPLASKTDKLRRWVAKVSYKNMLAFYSVGCTLDEIFANIKEKADTHFPNLTSLKNFQIQLKGVSLAEVDISEAFIVDFLIKSSPECKTVTSFPTELVLPLQMTLCPVVDIYDEDPWLSECRGILAKEEACYIANRGLLGPYSVAKLKEDDNGDLVWYISSRTGEKEPLTVRSAVDQNPSMDVK